MNKIENDSTKSSSWLNRDGRQPNSSLDEEAQQLIQEHTEYLKKKESLNIKLLEAIDFNILYVSQLKQTTQPIDYSHSNLLKFTKMEGIPPQLEENVNTLKFEYMTPIQKVVIPYIQSQNDLIACSETGSGKTVAYLFPIIGNMLIKGPPQLNDSLPNIARPTTLILVPTRELAEQVSKEAKKLCYKTGIMAVKVYGGVHYSAQEGDIRAGCDILVATPGRLIDFLKKGKILLDCTTTVIIDEADRMLEMNFEDQLRTIIVDFKMPNKDKRVNLMFSATFNAEVRDIAKKFLNDFYVIEPKQDSPKQIKQELIQAKYFEKNSKISNYLKSVNGASLIFLSTKRGVDSLAEYLSNEKFNVVSIHGDRSQFQRQYAINNFSNGSSQILIATDVASRGLDFPNVKYVINFDLPHNLEDYIHRIGRTGRMGQIGTAVSFVSEDDKGIIRRLLNFMKKQNQAIPSWFEEMCNTLGCDGASRFNRMNRFNNNQSSYGNGNGNGNFSNDNNTRERSRDNDRY